MHPGDAPGIEPGGRLLAVDFVKGTERRDPLVHFHRHGRVRIEDVVTAEASGFP